MVYQHGKKINIVYMYMLYQHADTCLYHVPITLKGVKKYVSKTHIRSTLSLPVSRVNCNVKKWQVKLIWFNPTSFKPETNLLFTTI